MCLYDISHKRKLLLDFGFFCVIFFMATAEQHVSLGISIVL